MASKNSFSRGAYRWMGGMSHVNSSQKAIYHYNIVEMEAHERTFYGSGQTVGAAEDQAEAKADLFLRIGKSKTENSNIAELLCGRAPCPARLYRDPLPPKEHAGQGKHLYVSDSRMVAMLNPQQNLVGPSAQPDPKVDKIRKFVTNLPAEKLLVVREILNPRQEFWDGEDLISKATAWEVLKFVMEGCNPAILVARRTLSAKNGDAPIFEHRLNLLDCELVGCGPTEEMAKQNVALNFLLWIRKKTLDILLEPSAWSSLPESIPPNPKIPQKIINVVMKKYTEMVKLMEISPDLRSEVVSTHMAAVVLQEFSTFRVISLACGNGTMLTKSAAISKDSSGFLLKDCHAEILALRATKLFLYDQLELFLSPEPKKSGSSIFTGGPHHSIMMKRGLGLHLYMGHKPCGHPNVSQLEKCSSPDRFLLYEKCGTAQQVKPVPADSSQNEILRIMSCCDKIQKKCFVGIQGHLLSQLTLPVYLGIMVIGGQEKTPPISTKGVPANTWHFFVPPQLEKNYPEVLEGERSPFGFDAVSPVVVNGLGLGSPIKTQNCTKEVAFCYYFDPTCGKTLLEYLDPETGKQLNGSYSLLCKRALLLRFRSLYDSIPPECLPSTATLNPRFRGTYLDYKSASIDYKAQKEFFKKLVKRTSAAKQDWIEKNVLWEKFTCFLEPQPKHYSDF